ncbi:MAG: hypothetical protein ACHQD9_03520 [Chitinophagales bacterium]
MKNGTAKATSASARSDSKNFLKRIPKGSFKSKKEFLELVGLWKGKKVTLDSIRKEAWK